jgi:L-ascorbate metabolism protein UlaG (beta-lactamase superfamily)
MKVTKFGQSCLVVEKAGKRLLIDPGHFFGQSHKLEELGELAAVLYTHSHQDHLDPELLPGLREKKICLYGNEDVVAKIGAGSCAVHDRAGFSVAGFDIVPIDIPHFQLPEGYGEPPPNTAYVIDEALIHPGDSAVHRAELKAAAVAAPIGGPAGEEFAKQSVQFLHKAGAKKAIPIHYDHFKFDPEQFARLAEGVEVVILTDGESTEL